MVVKSQQSNWEKDWKSPLKCQKDLKEISFIMNEQRNEISINITRDIHYDQVLKKISVKWLVQK